MRYNIKYRFVNDGWIWWPNTRWKHAALKMNTMTWHSWFIREAYTLTRYSVLLCVCNIFVKCFIVIWRRKNLRRLLAPPVTCTMLTPFIVTSRSRILIQTNKNISKRKEHFTTMGNWSLYKYYSIVGLLTSIFIWTRIFVH